MESLNALREMVGSLPNEACGKTGGAERAQSEIDVYLPPPPPEAMAVAGTSLATLYDSSGAALCYGTVDWGDGNKVGRLTVAGWVSSAHIPRAAAHVLPHEAVTATRASRHLGPWRIGVAVEVLCYLDSEVMFVRTRQGQNGPTDEMRYLEDAGTQSDD